MRVLILPIVLFLTGCASIYERGLTTSNDRTVAVAKSNFSKLRGPHYSEPFSTPVPDYMNELVQKWLNYFQGDGREYMNMYLARYPKYSRLMKSILKEHNLPEDLIYVVFIESGFSSKARSRASAVGYWQFVRGTGRAYGLKVNVYVDERRDPELATIAAANYFKSLYSLFGDWYLSMAAYNAGENKIKRVVMRNHTRNFWDLVENKQLPRETMNYVPKYLAARLIAKNPSSYGFYNIEDEPPLQYEKLDLKKSISLSKLAKHSGISLKTLKTLNPSILRDYVPFSRNDQYMKVPVDTRSKVAAVLDKSHVSKKVYARSHDLYVVRRGDTLSGIALKFGTKVSELRNLNNLNRRGFIKAGQKLRVYRGSSAGGKKIHIVRRGDTLSHIARRYKVSLSQLYKANTLNKSAKILVGRKIVIPN